MQNVQAENGHTDIANELLEALCRFRIPGMERQIFDAVLRKTWGWHKKECLLTVSQLSQITTMKRQNVHRALQRLVKHRLVIKNDDKLKINKNYLEWLPFCVISSDYKALSSKVITNVINTDYKLSSKVMTPIYKEIKEKKETKKKAFSFFRNSKQNESPKLPVSPCPEGLSLLRQTLKDRRLLA